MANLKVGKLDALLAALLAAQWATSSAELSADSLVGVSVEGWVYRKGDERDK